MRNLKKILALVLALMMVLSVMVTASAATYADDADIEHKEAVEVMSTLGILAGTGDNFEPDGILNREQAAKIVAYILNGGDLNATVLAAVENPFTDVVAGHWSEASIKYCYNTGIILGVGDNKFDPKAELTGYQFAKMLLIAAGICESADFVNLPEGTNWMVVTASNAKASGLLAGLADVVLSAPLSREHAAQMALNAMLYETEATGKYVVEILDSSKIPTYVEDQVFNSIVEAAVYMGMLELADANNGEHYKIVPQVAPSLLNTKFYTNFTSYVDGGHDAYGRPCNQYDYSGLFYTTAYNQNFYIDPVVTYNGPVTSTQIHADLGLNKSSSPSANWWIDGYQNNTDTQLKLSKYDSAWKDVVVGGYGADTEVYVHYNAYGSRVITVVQVNNYLGKVTNVVNYKPATAYADETAGYITVELYGTDYANAESAGWNPKYTYVTYYDPGFEKGDFVLVNAVNEHDGYDMSITSVEDAVAITGAVNKYSANTVTLAGTTYNKAVKATYDVTAIDFALANIYLTDDNGVVYGVQPIDYTPTNYAYVMKFEAQDYSYGTTLIGSGTDKDPIARASVIFADGTYAVIDLALTSNAAGTEFYYNRPLNGGTIGSGSYAGVLDGSGSDQDDAVYDWFAYTKHENGTYTLSAVNNTYAGTATSVTLADGKTTTLGSKYMTSSTVTTGLVINHTTKYVSKTGFTGLPTKDFNAGAAITADVLYTYIPGSNTIANIYVYGYGLGSTPAPTYAYALGANNVIYTDDYNYVQEWSMLVNGEAVDMLIHYTVGNAPVIGYSYTLGASPITGAYTINTAVNIATGTQLTVVVADSDYVVLSDGNTYYYGINGCGTYNLDVTTGHTGEADVVEVGDTVVVGAHTSYDVDLIYIVKDAE